jgi:positive regulator of sigma E activity
MKPSIPDIGTVIRLEGDQAVIRMKHEGSCYKCGAAAMGLCKGGLMQELTVRNTKQARVGDTVKIGLDQRVQYKGYVLAYSIPAVALVIGTVGGQYLGASVNFPPLDIIGAIFSMIVAAYFSLRRLKRLDSAHAIEIVQVFSDPWIPGCSRPDEAVSDYYASYY